ncbi:MAG: T9SS type A sorting domain-containing protein [Chitinophagaceae bacterium]|nr:T9SS type A sorting domain-containing protein [Chitinophagaceae bacterium]
MKSKILFQLFLLTGLGIVFVTMKSDIGGKYNGGTSCGSCHGNKNTATSVALNGLPTSFTPGTTYPLTFTVTNSSLSKAGFNLLVSGGTLTAGAGSKVNNAKTQITHTSPMAAVSGVTTFSFSWTAPTTTATITFSGVGNAVNDDQNDGSADQWNSLTQSVSGATATTVQDLNTLSLKSYPNPTSNFLTIEGFPKDAKDVMLVGVNGQFITPNISFNADKAVLNCANLAEGQYILHANIQGKTRVTKFVVAK